MINVYSIEEIIAASNAILTNQVAKKKSITDKGPALDKINKEIELSMNIKEKKLIDQSIPQEINNIILEAEKSQREKKINKPLKQPDLKNEHSLEDLKVTKEELVESMYLTFSKKIKKNTLKLIIELREEIIFLTKNISSLKENKKQQNYNKKLLQKDVIDLKKIEQELNDSLKITKSDFNKLKENKEKLESDHILLEEKNNNLNLDHDSLKNNLKNIQELLNHTNEQNNILENNNNEIKSQLTDYKNKEQESKLKIKKLEEEILINNKLLNDTKDNNNKIKSQISEINDYKQEIKKLNEKNQNLEKTIDTLKLSMSSTNDSVNIINDLENKIKHYQDENIRIGSELVESNKRFSVTKESLSALQNQRSDLIEKLNSINHVIKGENIVSNVFNEDLDQTSSNYKPENKTESKNLNKQIKDIFNR